jgi:ABC-type transporter Mla maintaining outer membrane lipid asymmetry ATPase subunit MlaF
LWDVAQNSPANIDRALQQRTALARALVLSPELLFLDNPLVGVGPRELRWWLQFLKALHDGHPLLEGRPLTLVLGSNDLQHWGRGHKFGLVHSGRFKPMGSREEIVQESNAALRELLPVDWLSSPTHPPPS